jgi:hypothetical protein
MFAPGLVGIIRIFRAVRASGFKIIKFGHRDSPTIARPTTS